jgi:PHP family Zn ribbon phosphoesterase
MKIISDLHIHSKYSRAVSKEMEIPKIWEWARIKGIDLIATGDWTHPLWMREIKANLEEMGNGLLKLKANSLPFSLSDSGIDTSKGPFFLLTSEISSIYSQGGKLRRIHNLLWLPSILIAEKISKELLNRGANLHSDGRPIVGLTSMNIAEILFSTDPTCLLVPAHIWTPWFSLYGSESGFDSIDECFGQYAKYIYAVETGLSSDPAMNWRIKDLDMRSLVSSSDSHSGPKLGREATVFDLSELSFKAIREALIKKQEDKEVSSILYPVSSIKNDNKSIPNTKYQIPNTISYTIEFHPEEGKYHYTGHRNCGIRQTPLETKKKGVICPVCGKKLTIGVMHRVEALSGRTEEEIKLSVVSCKLSDTGTSIRMVKSETLKNNPPYVSLVPLQEILAEALGGQVTGRKVQDEYKKLTDKFKGEFNVLMNISCEEIEDISGERIAQAVDKVRKGDMVVDPGYDGVFGVVKIWPDGKSDEIKLDNKEQLSLI